MIKPSDGATNVPSNLTIERRSPERVMRLERMGSAHPTRLSFLRTLLRRVNDENWRFERAAWDINANGVGHAVYKAIGPVRTYSLIVFAHDLPDDQRSDRVIATAWDATFTLFDGEPTKKDIDRLAENVPLQEAGRIDQTELCMGRANRSVRLFDHAIDHLSRGLQPDIRELESVGYLMRTTAVYGSGKFGAVDFSLITSRPELRPCFQVEMLAVWLFRSFTVDIINHMARISGGDKMVPLGAQEMNALGVGNSTGLGMAPFLVRHPMLINNWLLAREEALVRVRNRPNLTLQDHSNLKDELKRAQRNARNWISEHPIQLQKIADLQTDLGKVEALLCQDLIQNAQPWNHVWIWAETNLTLEGQEAFLAILLECNGPLVDGLADCMDANEHLGTVIDGSIPLFKIIHMIEHQYAWALNVDYNLNAASARFWYVSEEKLEPRLGERFEEPGQELELPLDIGRMVALFYSALCEFDPAAVLADFLRSQPTHRYIARRVLMMNNHPYGEVQDNLIDQSMMPIDLLRCKLSFFGATHFDPRSDRWVRISLFKGQDYPNFDHQVTVSGSHNA